MAESTKYNDPSVLALASSTEQKFGLPSGLLSSVITLGERSNSDQVSSAGARTVAQIIPSTRQAALSKYGVDAYLSTPNAVEVAGRLLKDSLDRNDGDAASAVREYIGGTNPANWGPTTKSYVNRVMTGLRGSQDEALSSDFAKFMAANPAVPAQGTQGIVPSKPAADDPLSNAFGAWAQDQANRATGAITPEEVGHVIQGQPDAPQSLGRNIVGAGEAALSTVTGATTGYLGALGGAASSLVNAAANKLNGGAPLPDTMDTDAAAAANALTYQPRTVAGQSQAQAVGEFASNTLPALAGAMPELSALHEAGAPVVAASRDLVRAAPSLASKAIKAGADAIKFGEEKPATPTPGTMASGGSAGTDAALQRQATADALPVPMRLTTGQATRSLDDQRFEGETAKAPDAAGAALRENSSLQNKQLGQNFDSLIDQTGAEKASNIEAGRYIVDDVLKSAAKASETKYRVKYKEADSAGETLAPADISPVLSYLNSQPEGLPSTALPDAAKAYAVKLGLASKDAEGQLTPLPNVNLRAAEAWRKEINKSTGYDPTDIRQATILKNLLDQQTQDLGGTLYKEARQARTRHAQLFENNQIVSDLLETKQGTADRRVALDDVIHRIVLQGSREDLGALRRTLDVSDQHAGIKPGTVGPGAQAWREVQGATWRHIAEEANVYGKNVARDSHGNPIISPAGLNKAIKALDDAGRLDFLLGKKGAQTARDLNEIASHVKTTVPGAINHSNTASVVLQALAESGAMGAITGLPLPVMTAIRMAKQHRESVKLRQRVQKSIAGVKK